MASVVGCGGSATEHAAELGDAALFIHCLDSRLCPTVVNLLGDDVMSVCMGGYGRQV